jgi:hypothetical protein
MPSQLELGWLFIACGFVLSLGAFILIAMIRSVRARSNPALTEFLGDYAGGVLLIALILEIFGIVQTSKVLSPVVPEQLIDSAWLWAVLVLLVWPGYGLYRALNFPQTVHLSSSQPRPLPRAKISKNNKASATMAESDESAEEDRPAIADEWQVRILEVMRSRDGLSLVDLGNKLGVDWRQLTVAARQLVHSGRLRKEGKFYYKR